MKVQKKDLDFYSTIKKDFFDSKLNRIVESKEFGFLENKLNVCPDKLTEIITNSQKEKPIQTNDFETTSQLNKKTKQSQAETAQFEMEKNVSLLESYNSTKSNWFSNVDSSVTPGNQFVENNTHMPTKKKALRNKSSKKIASNSQRTNTTLNSMSFETIQNTPNRNEIYNELDGNSNLGWNVRKDFADEGDESNQRFSRGLKSLSVKVRDIVYQQKCTSYRNVAEALVKDAQRDLWFHTEKRIRTKQEQNVRRRVYDALNVLIAANVLKKTGKNVCFNGADLFFVIPYKNEKLPHNFTQKTNNNHLTRFHTQKENNQKKKAYLKSLLIKLISLKNLLKRNSKNSQEQLISYPFIVVTPSKSNSCEINMEMNITRNRLSQVSDNKILMYSDQEALQLIEIAKSGGFSTKKLIETVKSSFPNHANDIISALKFQYNDQPVDINIT